MGIAIVALALYSTQSSMAEEESEGYVQVMADVRMGWQNTVLLFDEALRDAVNRETCAVLSAANFEANYLDNAIGAFNAAQEPGVECGYSITSPLSTTGPATFSASITCSRAVVSGGKTLFSAEYSKEVVFSAPC